MKPKLIKKIARKRELKKQLADKYGSFCYYCDTKLPFHKLTIDHIYPTIRRKKEVTNYNSCILACQKCNLEKGCRVISIEKFRKEIMGDKYYEISERISEAQKIKIISKPIALKPNFAQNIVYPKQILIRRASIWYRIKDFIKSLRK